MTNNTDLPIELRGIAEAVKEGHGFWRSCSGCYETNEGAPPNGAYFSATFNCFLGCGCRECGGIGAVWDDTDYEAMAQFMLAQDDGPTDLEAVIACLGDDAATLRFKNPECEIAANMDKAATLLEASRSPAFDLVAHLQRQAEFSLRTFGPGPRIEGVTDHITKELKEVRDSGGDLKEWVDVIILGFDGAWRSGATPQQIVDGMVAKQTTNEGRRWPDWRSAPEGKAIEHDRSGEAS